MGHAPERGAGAGATSDEQQRPGPKAPGPSTRDADPNSGTSQFFVNLADNHALDFESPTPGGWGYTVFGRVIKGTEVIDAMDAIPVLAGGDFMGDVPSREIVLNKARVLAADGK